VTGLGVTPHTVTERESIMSVHGFTVCDIFKRDAGLYRDKIVVVSEDQAVARMKNRRG